MYHNVWAGVDIGGTKCAITLAEPQEETLPHIIDKVMFPTPATPEATIARLIAELSDMLTSHSFTLDAIGIACGGPLDSHNGIILSPPNLPNWIDIPIVSLFHDAFHVPVYLCNDANAGALAEWRWGNGKGCDPFIFLTFGTGMGAGIIVNGGLLIGACDLGGEVGHLRLSDNGPIGFGKHGSFEGWCSGGGIARYAQTIYKKPMTAKLLADHARLGDPMALDVWHHTGQMLGLGLSLLIDTFNPECIVIGSLYLRCQDLLDDSMYDTLHQEAIPQSLASCEILPPGLKEHIGDYAALACIHSNNKQQDEP